MRFKQNLLVATLLSLPLVAVAQSTPTPTTTTASIADSTTRATQTENTTWIIAGGISRHTCRDCGFRESNPGMAVQWRSDWVNNYTQTDDWRLSAGAYINSNNRNSLYVAALWQPWVYGDAAVKLKAGAQVAVISNYLKQSITPTLLPAISVESKHLGADIFLVPKFPSVSAAVLVSIKLRF